MLKKISLKKIILSLSILIFTIVYTVINFIIFHSAGSKENHKATISICLAGDVMLARSTEPLLKRYGNGYFFNHLKKIFDPADISLINLENPAASSGLPMIGKPENLRFRSDPEVLCGLDFAGIDLVNLANNHTTDYGISALFETIEHLNTHHILSIGAGKNIDEAGSAVILERKNIRVAFLGYAEQFGEFIPAADNSPGIAGLNEHEIRKNIRTIRNNNLADIIILSLHWGVEYRHFPEKNQVKLAHQFIEAGVDVIVGHHPHVLQGIEIYQKKVIFYSLGNCIFDMINEDARKTALITLLFNKKQLKEIQIVPVLIDKHTLIPEIAIQKNRIEILKSLRQYSAGFKTYISNTEKGGRITLN